MDEDLLEQLRVLVDADWYTDKYADVRRAGLEPVRHYSEYGAQEGRDPNPFFDGAWYRSQYADVAASGILPLLHYLRDGAAELRNPHPRFDAVFYVQQHPEAASNPLLYHLLVGRARGWITEKPIDAADYLPSKLPALKTPTKVGVDIVIPVYRGFVQTQRCLELVLADDARMPGDIVVIDDRSPEPKLSAWLGKLAATGTIRLIRNAKNLGFVASVNKGMRAADPRDVILLNSDTEVPRGWTRRLAAQAYAAPKIASVSPFSNRATICSYPANTGGDMPFGLPLAALDGAAQSANAGRSVDVPTTVGFAMYIRRAALDEVGTFDAATFGRGYGEENDFCLRATARGWTHRLACDTFVYHEGEVSFGTQAPELSQAWQLLTERYPAYAGQVALHVQADAVGPARMALTIALFLRSGLPCLLMVSHQLGGGVKRHVDALAARLIGTRERAAAGGHGAWRRGLRYRRYRDIPLSLSRPTGSRRWPTFAKPYQSRACTSITLLASISIFGGCCTGWDWRSTSPCTTISPFKPKQIGDQGDGLRSTRTARAGLRHARVPRLAGRRPRGCLLKTRQAHGMRRSPCWPATRVAGIRWRRAGGRCSLQVTHWRHRPTSGARPGTRFGAWQ